MLLDLTLPAAAHAQRGAPSSLQALLECGSGTDAGASINYTLRWFNKTATHAPETLWLSHTPPLLAASPPPAVTVDKLGFALAAADADLGCDGAGSRVRKALGIELIGPAALQHMVNLFFKADLRELGTVEQFPKMEGRQLTMVIAPKKRG